MHPYLPHTLYTVALLSITMHRISQRHTVEEQRARANAQISILESMVQRLRSDTPLADAELDRLDRLRRSSRLD
jgi:hypothetical protein